MLLQYNAHPCIAYAKKKWVSYPVSVGKGGWWWWVNVKDAERGVLQGA